MSDSIPRTFAVAADQVLVLTREETGPTGADALSETLGRAVPNLHAAPGARAEAAVVVLGGARPISRSELYAALRAGSRHVSLVLPAGVSLAEAAVREEPPRRTRLPELLAAAPDALSTRTGRPYGVAVRRARAVPRVAEASAGG